MGDDKFNYNLCKRVFDNIFDEDDIEEMLDCGYIVCKDGFEAATIASISLALSEEEPKVQAVPLASLSLDEILKKGELGEVDKVLSAQEWSLIAHLIDRNGEYWYNKGIREGKKQKDNDWGCGLESLNGIREEYEEF